MHTPTQGPARPTPPGQILQRELDARNWTQQHLADTTHLPPQTIHNIITGNTQITPEIAALLGAALNIDPAFWSALQSKHNQKTTP